MDTGRKRGLFFDLERADRAINFFPVVLRLNGGQFEGIPFELQPAQKFIVGSIFGWVRSDGTRRFRIAYVEMGKGNGKSPLGGGMGLYCMVADDEPRAECYAAATKKDQAMIPYRDVVAMVNQSPALNRRLKKSGRDDKVWNLFDPKTNSFYRPISADDGQSGPRPHFGLIDELHEHKTPTVMQMMAAGRKWRRQPLILAITNSGTSKDTVCWEYREKGERVASGQDEDDTFFPYICALDEGEDPFKDESCWIKANPLLGSILDWDYLRDEVKGARGMPSKTSSVRRLNFCEWVEAHNPFIGGELWQAAAEDFTLEKFRGMQAIAGIDLSATKDLTAVVLVFYLDGKYWWWPMFWIPEDGLAEKVEKEGYQYDEWVREGHVFTTPGAAIDKDFVVSKVEEVCGEYGIEIIKAPYDRWRIDTLQGALDREGAEWPLEPFGQGFASFGPVCDELERAIAEGKLRHPNNPCLNMNAANAVTVSDPAGNRKLTKSIGPKKKRVKIDGIVAGGMALYCHAANKEEDEPEHQLMILG